MQNIIGFLGCNVSANCLKPTEAKINEHKLFPTPTNSKSLRRFLGMLNYYKKNNFKFCFFSSSVD